jgi:hypothetical protein
MEKNKLQQLFNKYQYLVNRNVKYYFQDCSNLDDIKQTGYLSIYEGILAYDGKKPMAIYLDEYSFLKMSDVADFDTLITMPNEVKDAIIVNNFNREYNPQNAPKPVKEYQYTNLASVQDIMTTDFTDNSALKVALKEVLKSSKLSYQEYLAILDKADLLSYEDVDPLVLNKYLKKKSFLLKRAKYNILRNKDVEKLSSFKLS